MAAVSAEVFLELLARDADPVEFERPLVDARAAGADAETLVELERAKVLALTVSSMLTTYRRREAHLAALFDTAGDLAALTGVDEVLEAIVRRARRLLGRDVAYLTLHDADRGDTYMRVTDGSTSAEFQRLRLPMGAGLGGLVAQTARPYLTANYLADDRFAHTQAIDAGVRDEGLVSILGVPLRLGARVIGVLFAADRRPRPFEREDVALLSSLAAHAAVALDNARLLAETRAALGELKQANALLRETTESMQRAADAHHRMAELVLRGGGVDDVAQELSSVLGSDVLVVDGESTEARSAVPPDAQVVPVVAGREELGYLVHDGPLDETSRRILERGAQVTALLLLFRRTVAEAESRGQRELLEDLLSGDERDLSQLDERARTFGVDVRRRHVVVVAHTSDRRGAAGQAAGFLADGMNGLAGRVDGRLVFMVPADDAAQAAAAVHARLSRTIGGVVTIGAASINGDLAGVPTAYREAARCLDALLALDRAGEIATAAELGFVGLLLARDGDIVGFVDRTLGALAAYDDKRGTGLVSTLDAYFAHGRSLSRTAGALSVHVNTVAQRLARITQLLGESWQEPERALELQLALRLHRLQNVSTRPPHDREVE